MANLGMVASPTSCNAYFAHDPKQEWKRKHPTNSLSWASKGSSFSKSTRFDRKNYLGKSLTGKGPAPGEYHDLHNGPLSCVLQKPVYRDLDNAAGKNKPAT